MGCETVLLLSGWHKKSWLFLWFLHAVPWTLNMTWISVCLGVSIHLPLRKVEMVITWCAGAGVLWNILSWEFNELHYNNESSKPVCAAAPGCESWFLELVIWCLAAGNLFSWLLCLVLNFWGLKDCHIQATLGLCPKYFVDNKSCGSQFIQKGSLKERRFFCLRKKPENLWSLNWANDGKN